jgi:predicted peroxiredoxin
MEVEVTIMLQDSAVYIAKQGCYEHVFAAGLPPLKELTDSFIEQGGTLFICSPCTDERKITPQMLVSIAQPVKAAGAVVEILEATQVMTH